MSISPVSSYSDFSNNSLTSAVVEPASLQAPAEPALQGSQAFSDIDSLTGSEATPASPARDEQSEATPASPARDGQSQAAPAAPAKNGQSQIFARIYA